MSSIHVIHHPLVSHHLTALRDRRTPPPAFRRSIQRLAFLTAYEATQDLKLRKTRVHTPLEPTQGSQLSQRVGLIPILRAGLALVDPILGLIPGAEVWHLGFYRDEKTLQPVEYYKKLPEGRPVNVALILDPMLATGGSALAAIESMRTWGVSEIKLLSMIAAPEGLDYLRMHAPEVRIYVCAVDRQLNEHGYILPGLGDAGDRTFNAQAAG